MDRLAEEVKLLTDPTSVYVNKLSETVFPHLKDDLKNIVHRKPDILVFRNDMWYIIEVTVCYDNYFDYAFNGKLNRYEPLIRCLTQHGIDVTLFVMCFGSLGCIRKDVRNNLRGLGMDTDTIKSFLSWASISCIIGSNYIWRHRVKKFFNS